VALEYIRIVESGDTRLTEAGDTRVTEGFITPSMDMYVKHSGTWKDSVPYVHHGGGWKIPDEIYKKVGTTWTRVL